MIKYAIYISVTGVIYGITEPSVLCAPLGSIRFKDIRAIEVV